MRYQSILSRRRRQRRDTIPHCLVTLLYGWTAEQHGTGIVAFGRERRIWAYRT